MVSAAKTVVITICSLRHRDVWELTSALLARFVEADEYHVYVPQAEIATFSEITHSKIKIYAQEKLGKNYMSLLEEAVSAASNNVRFGWYAQQFHKLEALRTTEADRLVIWDADCVPLRPISLFSGDGAPIYMLATEQHGPYFESIQRLLGLSRVQTHSFVIPGFPILKSWVTSFFQDVNSHNLGLTWYEAVILNTDLSRQSGFSETETLGTWVANRRPRGWSTSSVVWERRGQSRFGYARNLSQESVIKLGQRHGLDIVTFENWDKPKSPTGPRFPALVTSIFRAHTVSIRTQLRRFLG